MKTFQNSQVLLHFDGMLDLTVKSDRRRFPKRELIFVNVEFYKKASVFMPPLAPLTTSGSEIQNSDCRVKNGTQQSKFTTSDVTSRDTYARTSDIKVKIARLKAGSSQFFSSVRLSEYKYR